jgi:hypothetical protein
MASCPRCAWEIDDEIERCPQCGADEEHALLTAASTPGATRSSEAAATFAPPAPRGRASVGYAAGIALMGIAGAALTVLVLGVPGGAIDAPASAVPVAMAPTATDAPAAPPPSVPAWTDANRDRWVSSHPRSVAFELPARQRVAVWMGHVTPLLVVRCLAQTIDVFVVTETAAAMEAQDADHTVRLSFDDGPEEVARWPDSVDHDALFAPDGASFAQRLASARTLRFGFTPHNALPATVGFELAGADRVVAEVVKTCAPRGRQGQRRTTS